MALDQSAKLTTIHNQLIRIAQAWALRRNFDPERARELRKEAILINHSHYVENIPAYRRFAQEEGIAQLDEIEPIRHHLMLPDDLFKSYDQRWLDAGDFSRMNAWLSEIFHRRVDVDATEAESIDAWIERLERGGIHLVYSSGTSGTFSFIPRDDANWNRFRIASTCYLVPLLMYEKLGTFWQRRLVRLACGHLSPATFMKLTCKSRAAADYDAVFLDFQHGRTGNQALEGELAPFFRRHIFLYETELSPSVLRLVAQGAKTEQDHEQLMKLQEVVVGKREQNYLRVIQHLKQATADGQKVFIFGTTHQYKELCETMADHKQPVPLKRGSLVLFGGGWKSFTGERVSREELLTMISQNLNLPRERILEGYSMTEINAFMLRCDYGRFHIPPIVEPVIFDEALSPMAGDDLKGIFGFLDPLAMAYPGFIISGDQVRFVSGDCECGLNGPAVTEIGRAPAREIKGCGGIMASVAA